MNEAAAPRLHLDLVIAPRPSLPVRGFVVLLTLVMILNIAVGTLFFLMGAWPAPVFLGLDVLAVCIAFWASYRRGRLHERVQVTADHVRVLREQGAKSDVIWSSATAFTRVILQRSERYGAQVRLVLSGRGLTVGKALGPVEREALAGQIEDAIRAARLERHS